MCSCNINIVKLTSQKKIAPACKISVNSINSLRYSQFQCPVTRLTTPICHHVHPKYFDQLLIYVNCINMKKKQAILFIFYRLAENILAHISGTKIFPNMRYVQEHIK